MKCSKILQCWEGINIQHLPVVSKDTLATTSKIILCSAMRNLIK